MPTYHMPAFLHVLTSKNKSNFYYCIYSIIILHFTVIYFPIIVYFLQLDCIIMISYTMSSTWLVIMSILFTNLSSSLRAVLIQQVFNKHLLNRDMDPPGCPSNMGWRRGCCSKTFKLSAAPEQAKLLVLSCTYSYFENLHPV